MHDLTNGLAIAFGVALFVVGIRGMIMGERQIKRDLIFISLFLFTAPARIYRWWWRRRWLDGIEMGHIDMMFGHEFEHVCQDVFLRLGYSVRMTPGSGDQGADLIIEKDGRRIVVQAKRCAGKIGNYAVQEVVAAKGFYKADHAIVISNSYFTRGAVALAKANQVDLHDRAALAKMLSQVKWKRARPDQRQASLNHVLKSPPSQRGNSFLERLARQLPSRRIRYGASQAWL